MSWVAHALTSAPSQLYHANIFYPHRYALAFSEANLGAGVIGMPAWLLTGNPYTTHNVALLAAFVMACCGAYYLCRHLTGSRHAAAVAGVLFGFCPFIFARTAHIQLLFIGTLPFCLLAFHRLVERPTVVTCGHARRAAVDDRPHLRVLRHLCRPDGRSRHDASSRGPEGFGDRATTGSASPSPASPASA